MTMEELREKLLQIEDYESESYRLWQEYQKRAEGAERAEEIWEAYQKEIEGYIAVYEEKGLKNQIPILDISRREAGEQEFLI